MPSPSLGSVFARSRPPDPRAVEDAVRSLLEALGLDPGVPALSTTPTKVRDALLDGLLDGYGRDSTLAFERTYPVVKAGPVAAVGISTRFVCPHHLLAAEAVVDLAYWPDTQVAGLSKLIEFVDILAHRLVLQEDLGEWIADGVMQGLNARAAVARISARHGCVAVEQPGRSGVTFRTLATRGEAHDVRSLLYAIDARFTASWTSASEAEASAPGSSSRSVVAPESAGPPNPRTD